MAKCNNCGKTLSKTAQFCGFCGAKVLEACPRCGNTELPGPNFCIRCGAPLRNTVAPSPGAPPSDEDLEAELKVYKASWEEGQHVVTCPHCGAKNRVPVSKLQLGASCGRCRQPLPAS
jgi:double zinc ribbon protein/thioredoxin family protein